MVANAIHQLVVQQPSFLHRTLSDNAQNMISKYKQCKQTQARRQTS